MKYLPQWLIKTLPWFVGILGLIFAIALCLAMDELTNDLVRYWLS